MEQDTKSAGQARWLAPLAVAVLAIVTLIVISGSSVDETSDVASQGTPNSRQAPESTRSKGPEVYVVQPGDTLSSISVETGVSVEELQRLNPEIDPQALGSGQRLKLP